MMLGPLLLGCLPLQCELSSHLSGHRETAIPFISDIIDFWVVVFAELRIGNAFVGRGGCPVSAQMVLADHELWSSSSVDLAGHDPH